MKKIGIEKGLTNVAGYLIKSGYTVESLSGSIDENIKKLSGLDAIVTAGYNTDMMGISDTETNAPVINARGLTPEEVKNRLDQELR